MMIPFLRALVAFCFVILAYNASAQTNWQRQEGDQKQHAAGSEHGPTQFFQPSPSMVLAQLSDTTSGREPRAAKYEPDCGQPKTHDEADFCVQRRVADAAEQSLHLSQTQTIVGVGGLVAVIITLGLSFWTGQLARKSADAAVSAAEQGQKSTEAAVRAAEIAERAFYLDRRAMIVQTNPQMYGEEGNFEISVINSGKSEALNVVIFADVFVEQTDLGSERLNGKEVKRVPLLKPGESLRVRSQADIALYGAMMAASRGEIRLLFCGSIQYTDRLKGEYQTDFCYSYHGEGVWEGKATLTPFHNAIT